MKKIIAFFLALELSLIACIAYAVDFDPRKYSNEELAEIQKIIAHYLPQTTGNQVLYDENGLYVEYRGIYFHSENSWIINLYVDNLFGKDVYVSLRNGRVNRVNTVFGNSGYTIKNDSIFLASTTFSYIINVEKIKEYGFTNLDRINFDLLIKSGGINGDTIIEMPITINTDIPINN